MNTHTVLNMLQSMTDVHITQLRMLCSEVGSKLLHEIMQYLKVSIQP